jgi:hypothetical protein
MAKGIYEGYVVTKHLSGFRDSKLREGLLSLEKGLLFPEKLRIKSWY